MIKQERSARQYFTPDEAQKRINENATRSTLGSIRGGMNAWIRRANYQPFVRINRKTKGYIVFGHAS